MIDHPDRQPPDLSDGAPPASRCAYSLAPPPRGDGGVSRIRTGFDRRHVLRAMAALPLVYSARIPAAADYAGARRGMLEAIARLTSLTAESTGVEAIDPAVMAAIDRVPRHEFVPEAAQSSAYANRPLSIGHGQTISQPYIVALMTHLLGVEPGGRVLEIGTGSGYQAAVLAELATHVHTIEIVEPLAREADRRLERLGYDGVRTRLGDGYHGWLDAAPFDAIIVTAAAAHVPPPLVGQLAPRGVLVIPVGEPFSVQLLLLVRKRENGEVSVRQILPVRFVPLTGGL